MKSLYFLPSRTAKTPVSTAADLSLPSSVVLTPAPSRNLSASDLELVVGSCGAIAIVPSARTVAVSLSGGGIVVNLGKGVATSLKTISGYRKAKREAALPVFIFFPGRNGLAMVPRRTAQAEEICNWVDQTDDRKQSDEESWYDDDDDIPSCDMPFGSPGPGRYGRSSDPAKRKAERAIRRRSQLGLIQGATLSEKSWAMHTATRVSGETITGVYDPSHWFQLGDCHSSPQRDWQYLWSWHYLTRQVPPTAVLDAISAGSPGQRPADVNRTRRLLAASTLM